MYAPVGIMGGVSAAPKPHAREHGETVVVQHQARFVIMTGLRTPLSSCSPIRRDIYRHHSRQGNLRSGRHHQTHPLSLLRKQGRCARRAGPKRLRRFWAIVDAAIERRSFQASREGAGALRVQSASEQPRLWRFITASSGRRRVRRCRTPGPRGLYDGVVGALAAAAQRAVQRARSRRADGGADVDPHGLDQRGCDRLRDRGETGTDARAHR